MTVSTPILVGDAPGGYEVDGWAVNSSCAGDGDVYIVSPDGDSWLVCEGDVWLYTTDDPSDFGGYVVYDGAAGPDESGGDDAS